jgi:prepilin-type N-terminal cleavage/methylation domain-containing protein
METRAYKTGFTLVEMIVVIAIIAILISMVATIAKRIDDQGKERLTRETITLLGNALEQFRDFGYEYQDANYAGLVFPLDCNGFNDLGILQDTLHDALYPNKMITIINSQGAQHDPNFSGSEALYFILSQVPDCRVTLDKIDKSLLTNKGKDKVTDITITISPTGTGTNTTTLPFTRIIDPWGTTLRYDYYPEYTDYILANPGGDWPHYILYRNSALKTFPVITSAGPDKQFDTADDISNVK